MAQQLTLGARDSTPVSSIRTPPPDADEEQSGRAWARQVKDPWDPAILTLDGGGIRGYSSLLILQTLMHEIAEWERRLDKEEDAAKLVDRPVRGMEVANGGATTGRLSPLSTTGLGISDDEQRSDAEEDTIQDVGAAPNARQDMEGSQALSGQLTLSSTTSHDFARSENRAGAREERVQDTNTSEIGDEEEKLNGSLPAPTPSISHPPEPLPSAHETHLPNGSVRPGIVEDELRPCHYFDFMYGTSTGGLIATLLGRLRLTVPQCLEIYREVGNDLFGTKRSVVPFATKYDHRPLEEAVKNIIKKHCIQHDRCDGEDWNPWNMEDDWEEGGPTDRICQT